MHAIPEQGPSCSHKSSSGSWMACSACDRLLFWQWQFHMVALLIVAVTFRPRCGQWRLRSRVSAVQFVYATKKYVPAKSYSLSTDGSWVWDDINQLNKFYSGSSAIFRFKCACVGEPAWRHCDAVFAPRDLLGIPVYECFQLTDHAGSGVALHEQASRSALSSASMTVYRWEPVTSYNSIIQSRNANFRRYGVISLVAIGHSPIAGRRFPGLIFHHEIRVLRIHGIMLAKSFFTYGPVLFSEMFRILRLRGGNWPQLSNINYANKGIPQCVTSWELPALRHRRKVLSKHLQIMTLSGMLEASNPSNAGP